MTNLALTLLRTITECTWESKINDQLRVCLSLSLIFQSGNRIIMQLVMITEQ